MQFVCGPFLLEGPLRFSNLGIEILHHLGPGGPLHVAQVEFSNLGLKIYMGFTPLGGNYSDKFSRHISEKFSPAP